MTHETNLAAGAAAALIETCIVGFDLLVAEPLDQPASGCRGRSRSVIVSREQRLDEFAG